MFEARFILMALGTVFLALAGWRVWRQRALGPQARAWLIVGLVFWGVGLWLGSMPAASTG